MNKAVPSLMFVTMIIISSTVTAQQQGNTCNACNCQFSNIKIFTQLIESAIAESVGKLRITLPYSGCIDGYLCKLSDATKGLMRISKMRKGL